MREVIWLQLAEARLQELFGHLEDSAENSGVELLTEIDRSLEHARRFPEAYREVLPGFHRIVVGSKRQFGIFYSIELRGIIIHTIENLRQDPERIRWTLGVRD